MLDKYFGFLKMQDENSVVDSLIEHCRIDEEELNLLSKMVHHLMANEKDSVEEIYLKIKKISTDSSRIFENTAEHIIQATFDHQKQYDLLRLYQRIENISRLILITAKHLLIFEQIDGNVPESLKVCFTKITKLVLDNHLQFQTGLAQYRDNKKMVFKTINKVEEIESIIENHRTEGLQILYTLANEGGIKVGSFKALENLINGLESISDAVQDGATSIEWLLLL